MIRRLNLTREIRVALAADQIHMRRVRDEYARNPIRSCAVDGCDEMRVDDGGYYCSTHFAEVSV